MLIIKRLSKQIEKEMAAAEDYIDMALELKDSSPDLARNSYSRSVARMDIVRALHDDVVAIINAYKKEKGEPPAGMQAIYDYLHEQHIELATQIKMKQELFK